MECACLPNNGPRSTPEPHMIPGYMGYIPQYKYKFGTTYGQQTNRLFLDPCVNMSPRAVLTDVCPEDCSAVSANNCSFNIIIKEKLIKITIP